MTPPAAEPVGRYRYGVVLALAVVLVVFLVLAPDGPGSRAIGMLLASAMLLVATATSRGVRASGAALLALATAGLALAVVLGWVPQWTASATAGVLVVVTLARLVHGLARLLSDRGVTVPAIAAALAIYLLLGVLFAFAVGTAARADAGPFFEQGFDGTVSQQAFYSFATLTTTGYGDLTPATRGGRALSVLEMLSGQIFLVTVIALLVGNLRQRRG